MKKNNTNTPGPALTLPISLENYQQLLNATGRTGFTKEAWEIGAAAIQFPHLCNSLHFLVNWSQKLWFLRTKDDIFRGFI